MSTESTFERRTRVETLVVPAVAGTPHALQIGDATPAPVAAGALPKASERTVIAFPPPPARLLADDDDAHDEFAAIVSEALRALAIYDDEPTTYVGMPPAPPAATLPKAVDDTPRPAVTHRAVARLRLRRVLRSTANEGRSGAEPHSTGPASSEGLRRRVALREGTGARRSEAEQSERGGSPASRPSDR